MKISIITISFNQAQFLRESIESVLRQREHVDLQYIVVDPGSTDGSREIIEKYARCIDSIIFEPDQGPADGLNRGLSIATGDILGYINSDDILLPDALLRAVNHFKNNLTTDVVYGHGYIIDENGRIKRKCFSDTFSLRMTAYGCCVVVQPSTFFRLACVRESGGFNVHNKSNWDGELLIDLALRGARFQRVDDFFSSYRVHGSGITGSGRLADLHQAYSERMFQKLMQRPRLPIDRKVEILLRTFKHLSHPRAAWERLVKGPVFATKAP